MSPTRGTLRVSSDLESLSHEAGEFFLNSAQNAVGTHGRFSVSLSGGSTPQKLYRLLATEPFASQIPWAGVHFFWGDERYVSQDHPDSNYRMVKQNLLDHIPIPAVNVHPMPTGYTELEDAARAYSEELERFFEGDIRFDLALMGMGPDGHTASLFPGDPALQVTDHPVAVAYPTSQPTARLTLTIPVFNQSQQVVFLISGTDKAKVLSAVVGTDETTYPSQLILP
ncbi:MAG: 6-phosphogluconolactonase, partial [Gemmatimonadaceae bacterium]|nr:6-phosphogluconolactonase [Gloeobacterales cyanobacterium ES-bin-141]